MKGIFTKGKAIASVPKWKELKLEPIKIKSNHLTKKLKKKLAKRIKKYRKKAKPTEKKVEDQPTYSIKKDLSLVASKVYYTKDFKKPVGTNEGVSGSLTYRNGVVEGASVTLPNGKEISIESNDEMNGSTFQYIDDETGLQASALFYKEKEGSYIMTLSNDPRFQGARIRFTAQAEEPYEQEEVLAEINNEQEYNQQEDEYAKNDLGEDEAYQDEYQASEESHESTQV